MSDNMGSPSQALVQSRVVDVSTATGTIVGTLLRPASSRTVVLIIAGSGPVDGDGNTPPYLKTDMYRMLADRLADHGIASLRYDKRGIGASRSAMESESALRFDDYIADAAAWISRLRSDAFGTVVIAGHSEGSLIGMIAAQHIPVDAFVSLEGAGFPAADVLREQLGPQLAPTPDLAAASERILLTLLSGRVDNDVPAPLAALYRPSVQPYLISWFRYDPRVEIAKVPCSVTVVQGTADIQVGIEHGQALAAAHPGSTFVTIPGMSHVLKAADAMSREQQIQTVYADPTLPIEPRVVDAIVARAGR